MDMTCISRSSSDLGVVKNLGFATKTGKLKSSLLTGGLVSYLVGSLDPSPIQISCSLCFYQVHVLGRSGIILIPNRSK